MTKRLKTKSSCTFMSYNRRARERDRAAINSFCCTMPRVSINVLLILWSEISPNWSIYTYSKSSWLLRHAVKLSCCRKPFKSKTLEFHVTLWAFVLHSKRMTEWLVWIWFSTQFSIHNIALQKHTSIFHVFHVIIGRSGYT